MTKASNVSERASRANDRRGMPHGSQPQASALPPFKTAKTLDEDILPDIFEAYTTRSSVPGLCAPASPEAIAARDYSLAVADFVPAPAPQAMSA